ncbi:MAG: hypothetical protein IID14_03235 [Candidatus Marinimicrobia bacterium]|nr:hypothetical protein [Candidatus Neomarinimicrobiota bacterium]
MPMLWRISGIVLKNNTATEGIQLILSGVHHSRRAQVHTHFADWYRQASFKPEDSWLKLRWQAVEAAASETSASKICELARLYHRKPLKAPEFEDQFRLKFHEADNAFQMSGNDFEMSLLAGATLLTGWSQERYSL